MSFSNYLAKARQHVVVGTSVLALVANLGAPVPAAAQQTSTKSPIQHVIVIIGENRTFDHIFATYKPVAGQKVDNLLSKGIIDEDGTPGPNFFAASQWSAVDKKPETYQMSPQSKSVYSTLPTPLTGGAPTTPYFASVKDARKNENGLPSGWYKYLTTGGTGLPTRQPDTRIPNVNSLPSGPFQLTSSTLSYDDYAASPVHRFYQMWQQSDCNVAYISASNAGGCLADLFPWVEVTVGAGSNGKTQPAGFNDQSTGEGSTAMGFLTCCKAMLPT